MIIVSRAHIQATGTQRPFNGPKEVMNTRTMANAAAFGAVAMNTLTGAGAP